MSQLSDLTSIQRKKINVELMFVAFVIGCVVSSFITARIVSTGFLEQQLTEKTAANEALKLQREAYLQAVARADAIESKFDQRLNNLKIENTTYELPVRIETEKTVYTDCKIPESGVNLLLKRVDDTNKRIIQRKFEPMSLPDYSKAKVKGDAK